MMSAASKLIRNIVVTLAGGFLMLGGLIGVAIVCVYAFALVMVRRLNRLVTGRPEHTLSLESSGSIFRLFGFRVPLPGGDLLLTDVMLATAQPRPK